MFSERTTSFSWRRRSKTGSSPPTFSPTTSARASCASRSVFCEVWPSPPLGRKRMPPRLLRGPNDFPELLMSVTASVKVYVLQQPERDQGANHRTAAITKQRQRDSRHGHDAYVHTDVDE